MKRRRLLKRLNAATIELREPGIWLLDEQFATSLREAMLAAWRDRDGDPASLAAKIGANDWSNADELLQIVDGIGVVNVSGMLFPKPNVWTSWGMATATSDVVDAALGAIDAKDVRGVLLLVDSPGGRAQGVFEGTRRIRAAAAAAGKPVWSFVDGCAASGGYALACAGTKILSSDASQAGSIGAIMIHTQYRPEDQTYTVVRYGEQKALGNPYEPFSDAAKAEWKNQVNAVGLQFENLVADMRGISLEAVQKDFGRGSVFFGAEAVKRGLVDQLVDSPEAAVELMRKSLGLSNGSTSQRSHGIGVVAAEKTATQGVSTMNPRLKAALFARGLIAAIDAVDDVCKAALAAFFAGRGQAQPADDDACISALVNPVASMAAVAEPLKPATGAAASHDNPLQRAHDREQAEARAAGAASERERQADLRKRGAALGVSAAAIEKAITDNLSISDALVEWTKNLEGAKPPLKVDVLGERGAEAFEKDAVDAMLIRCGVNVEKPSDQAQKWGRSGVPMVRLAKHALSIQGARVSDLADDEDVAIAALKAGVGARSEVLIDDAGALNRPASFPNLLSGLANKLFDEGVARANASYPDWTGVIAAGLPDLKPVPVVSKSTVYILDEVVDDEELKELKLAEEILSAIQVRRFKNKFGWTPVMIANDDLGAFAEGMLGYGAASENTVNLLCLNLLTANPTLLDGYALFDDTNHGNDVTSGAAPSAAQWESMDLKVAAQRPVGGNGYVRANLSVCLVPPQKRVAALQVLAPFGQLPEMKTPTTDSTLNVYRDTGKVVVEPELQANSTTKYYGLCDPTIAPTVVRVYQRGWGTGPKRTAWVDPETGTSWVAFETRVGAAIKNYRTVVRNAGA